MAEEGINTSLAIDIIALERGNLRSSSLGEPSALKSGQNEHPYYHGAFTGSDHDEGNSRRHSSGKPTLPKIGQNILPRHIRASAGSFHDVVNSRRHSSEKLNSPNWMESVSPRYLRASTGSCHDFCKYGRKHAAEIKASFSISKKVMTPSLDRPDPTESGVPAERKSTTKVVKPKSSPVSETFFSNSSLILKQQVSLPKRVDFSLRQASANEKNKAQNEKKKIFTGKRIPSMKPKTTTLTPLSSLDPSGGLKGSRNSEIKIGKKTGSSKAAVKKMVASPSPYLSQIPSINRTVSLNVKKCKSLKLFSLKDQNMVTEAELKLSDDEKVPEKTLHFIKVETENKVTESTQSGSSLHSPSSPLLLSPKFSSLPKSPSFPFNEAEAQEEFEYTDSEVDESDDSISESCETVSLHEVEPSDANCSRAPRKGKFGICEDKDCSPMKLKFTRGKVLDLQSENSGPWKLRFRRGRVLGENQNDSKAEVPRRRFKKTGVDIDNTNGNNADSGKVVLRHQDVEGKKDAQGLFNNVIEETASKLVESRKSKVKALVGAFETVISLQESKPSPQTVS
ncbi:hypothetical protein U1Q18_039000 [Sarracenia purpurea var. burkii]